MKWILFSLTLSLTFFGLNPGCDEPDCPHGHKKAML